MYSIAYLFFKAHMRRWHNGLQTEHFNHKKLPCIVQLMQGLCFFSFSVFFRCSWSSAGFWARTASRNSMSASIGTVLITSSYFDPREGMLATCWHRFHNRTGMVHTHDVLGIVFHRFCNNSISQCYFISCEIQSKHCLVGSAFL